MGVDRRRIALGVTGGIAAYKAVEVCRRLVDAGAYVIPILTDSATKMVGAKTFSALASEPAKVSLWNDADVSPHTTVGRSIDLAVVCPATARSLSDLRTGRSNDLLIATLLATAAPTIVCPAMHTEMWEHPAVQETISVLTQRGVTVVPPADGPLAGGDSGVGRLASVETIMATISQVCSNLPQVKNGSSSERTVGSDRSIQGLLSGTSVVVTAGGTREPIDPVRFIGNRSSGKQGHALAEVAASRGASVTLITTAKMPTSPTINRVEVGTAAEMATAVFQVSDDADVVIMAAAVADFRPATEYQNKVKKAAGVPKVELVPTEDILAQIGKSKQPGQIIVGFAAETDNLVENAARKLSAKSADVIVANDVGVEGVGFDHETNAVTILNSDGTRRDVGVKSKTEIAESVLDTVIVLLNR